MNYKEAIEYINDKNRFGSRLGLETIARLLELLGNPEKDLRCIHIGGTNGKGSTSSFISNILIDGGYRIGAFTSPYINRFNERISLNNKELPDDVLARLTEKVKEKCDQMLEVGFDHPTTFEIITAIAFLYFKEEAVDYVLLEVGLGGRFDSTNIINNPEVVVITTIDYDHMDVLGGTLAEIAYEKSGIIKEDSLVVSYMQEDQVKKVLDEETFRNQGEIYYLKEDEITVKNVSDYFSLYEYRFDGVELDDLKIRMLGNHQIYNSALAIKTTLLLAKKDRLEISVDNIKNGLEKTIWPGRLEFLMKEPKFLIDGAHNIQSVKALIEFLDLFEYERLILGIGVLKDKNYRDMFNLLIPRADRVIATEINMPRGLGVYELMQELNRFDKEIDMEKNIEDAIEKSLDIAEEGDLILFAGSLYLIAEARRIIKKDSYL